MRIATGKISHESSTFTPVETTWESYRLCVGYFHGQEILDTYRETNTPMGGFIEGAEAHGFELIPTVAAGAHPSGPTRRDVFDAILKDLLDGIRNAGEIDGVLLELHGSMVAEGIDDADGHILAAVREVVGADVFIVGQLDIHTNMSQQMVEMADVLIGRETYPEIDMAERGRECADVLVKLLNEGLRPTMALHQIPMIWGINQVTAHSPMSEAIAELHRLEQQPGVLVAYISTGYPLADVPFMGSSVTVVTNDDLEAAQAYADQLGKWIFDRKEDWQSPQISTRDALEQMIAVGKYPIIVADRDDNTGGGSPGDSTGMLKTFIEAGLEDVCVLYIVDPESIAQCEEAGIGSTVSLQVGGKSSPLQGTPAEMEAEVVSLSAGKFRYDGPMLAGLEGNMGPSAYIRQGGIHVLLVTIGEQPFDTAFARSMGLEPKKMKFIGVKSTAHFRAGFESWAGQVMVVSEPSVHSSVNLPFKRLGRKLYPFDDI